MMTERIREFPPPTTGPTVRASWLISTLYDRNYEARSPGRCRTAASTTRSRPIRRPKILAVLSRPWARASTAPVSPKSTWRWLPVATPDRDLLRQHDQEGARHRGGLCPRHQPVCGRLPRAEVEKISSRGARRPCLLPHPQRLRRCRMAAIAKIRLLCRSCAIDVLEHAHRRRPRSPTVFRFTSARSSPIPEAWDSALADLGTRSSAHLSERGIQLRMVNLGGGFPAKLSQGGSRW